MEMKNPKLTEIIQNRYEFIILIDVENGNPNGDPDSGNMPRIDAETGHGLITDVCIKRKIRNYVELVKEDQENFKIYVKQGSILNNTHQIAYDRNGIKKNDKGKVSRKDIPVLRKFMCDNYYDVRTFGAVMTTEVNCGIVRGPVQLNFAKSIDPIFQQEVTITRVAITNEKDIDKKTTEMGRKHIVPYGLYRMEGYVSAALANKVTGFSEYDLELLWEAIINMFEDDHSSARGKMAVRKLIVFKHNNIYGNAPSHQLFDLVKVEKNIKDKPSRSFSDYTVFIDRNSLPSGVELIEKL